MKEQEKNRIQQAFKDKMDYDELMKCTRCGFCLPSCPTYIETNQNEVHSPRGRIALMKGLVDGVIEPSDEVKESIDLCLGCRACEPVCPSGVQFGHLLEQARDAIYQTNEQSFIEKTTRSFAFNKLFPHQNRMQRATSLIGFYQRSGLQTIAYKTKAIKLVPKDLRAMEKVLPDVPKRKLMKQRPEEVTAIAPRRKRVAFFSGCLMDTMFLSTNDATIKLLQYAGCDIVIPKTQACCGALHGHSGERESAMEMAKRNIEAFEDEEIDYIITNAGGCGAFLNDYEYLLRDDSDWQKRAADFSNKIKDISSILVDLQFNNLDLRVSDQIVTYQDSCHLKNGQHTFVEPRELIEAIDGVTYIEMKDASRCCGSAGIYNIVESEMSMQILDYKMTQVKKTAAKTILTANPGCLLQMKLGIEREGLTNSVQAVHLVDFLLQAYEQKEEQEQLTT